MKQLVYPLFAICILFGCKKSTTNEETSVITDHHIPAPAQYTVRYDYSIPPERIDVESAMATSQSVRLSQVASHIEYYAVGDDKYPVTDVVAVEGGFIALNQPKLYLYRQGMKRKRVGLKTEYNNWKSTKHLYYDKASTRLYTFLKKFTPESTSMVDYIGVLPPLDSVLARVYYLYPDSLPASYYPPTNPTDRILTFNSEVYTIPYVSPKGDVKEGITLFKLNGDTICRFPIGIDSIPEQLPGFFGQYSRFEKAYWYKDQLSFCLTYCDTIFRLPDYQTIKPAFYVHMGKHRFSLDDARLGRDRKNKAWMTALTENEKAVFLNVYKEGKTSKEGWITDKAERDIPSIDHQIVYLKGTKKTASLPSQSGMINDLDGGLSFWPDGQTDEYLYMIRPATELKKNIRLTGSANQKKLRDFLEEVGNDQYVLIVVR